MKGVPKSEEFKKHLSELYKGKKNPWNQITNRNPEKIRKKVNFFTIFSNFITLLWHTWDATVQVSRPTNHFEGSYNYFPIKYKKIRFSKIFQRLDLILTGTRKFKFLCSYEFIQSETANSLFLSCIAILPK